MVDFDTLLEILVKSEVSNVAVAIEWTVVTDDTKSNSGFPLAG